MSERVYASGCEKCSTGYRSVKLSCSRLETCTEVHGRYTKREAYLDEARRMVNRQPLALFRAKRGWNSAHRAGYEPNLFGTLSPAAGGGSCWPPYWHAGDRGRAAGCRDPGGSLEGLGAEGSTHDIWAPGCSKEAGKRVWRTHTTSCKSLLAPTGEIHPCQ